MNSNSWFGSVITLEPRGFEIEEGVISDATPYVIDQFDDKTFVIQR